jgi:hypothetical protein
MSNYTKNNTFTNLTGVIDGADFDSEYDEIATAVASKEDAANKGANNGYAGLDANGLVAASDLPDASETAEGIVERATDAETLTGTDTARVITPANLTAKLAANAGMLGDIYALTDPGVDTLLGWDDSAGAVIGFTAGTGLQFDGTTIEFDGDASNLTSGTIPAARVGASSVTQHQASLSIAETQIPNGSILARVASAETISGTWTISGAWTFSSRPKFTSAGGFLSNASSSNAGGRITLSDSEPASAAAIGSAGDFVFEY